MYKKIILLTVLLFSEIVGIVYAVMAGVVGTILLTAFCIKKLIKKSSSPVKHVHSEDADPESSVEPRNPENSNSC
uniref:Glycophorin-A n=1 Tax=Suricata suricatta TaxID=37032 RepID=A0A673SKL3_SURSU